MNIRSKELHCFHTGGGCWHINHMLFVVRSGTRILHLAQKGHCSAFGLYNRRSLRARFAVLYSIRVWLAVACRSCRTSWTSAGTAHSRTTRSSSRKAPWTCSGRSPPAASCSAGWPARSRSTSGPSGLAGVRTLNRTLFSVHCSLFTLPDVSVTDLRPLRSFASNAGLRPAFNQFSRLTLTPHRCLLISLACCGSFYWLIDSQCFNIYGTNAPQMKPARPSVAVSIRSFPIFVPISRQPECQISSCFQNNFQFSPQF